MTREVVAEPRRAGPADAFTLAELWLRARRAAIPLIPAPVHEDNDVRSWFRTVVIPTTATWMIDGAAGPLALIVLQPGWIDQLYVDPDLTGRGLGSTLVDLAKVTYPDGLDLWTFQANMGAWRFYERHGFLAVSETDGDNEEGAPDVRYYWSPDR